MLRASRLVGLATLLFLFGSESSQNAIANGETRTLTMHHMHTGEDITVTFKRNGRYDEAALQKLNAFLRDWRREESTRMDPHLLDLMWEVYREVGGQQPIQIVCGYRSPSTNAMLRKRSRGVARFSQHMLGKAIDFYIPDASLEEVRIAGLRLQQGGVGFYPTSGSPFVHLDTGSVRHWPRMTHDQLAHVFPRGKTVHVPTDGRPLPGYAVALAEIQRRGGSVAANAADQDERTVVAQRSRRGLIERLFGFGEDDEEEAAAAAPPAASRLPATASRAQPSIDPAKQQLASAIPLPPIRPTRPSQPAQGQFSLASVSPSPADIVKSRGAWTAEPAATEPSPPVAAAAPAPQPPAPGAIGSNGQRFVWLTGPTGRPLDRPPAQAQASEPPRPPAEIPVVDTETTANVSPWPLPSRNDRVPADLALAYAAVPGRDAEMPRPAPVPIAASRLVPPAPLAMPRAPSLPAAAPKPGQRADNPWLRGLMIAPSVHYTMRVATFGALDYRRLVRFMHKPDNAIAMTFSADPHAGMTSGTFAGPAVTFLPTIKFVTRTAGLN